MSTQASALADCTGQESVRREELRAKPSIGCRMSRPGSITERVDGLDAEPLPSGYSELRPRIGNTADMLH